MHPLIVRRDAAQAVRDTYFGKPFAWGRADCVRMCALDLRKLGYRVSLLKAPQYSSEKGARLALARAGFDSLEALLDAQGFIRIPPAAALPADIVALSGAGDWPSLMVALGNGATIGFHEGQGKVLRPQMDKAVAAWRVDPCRK
jgi:hypothetical protein